MAITDAGQYLEYDNVKDTFPVSTSLTGTITKNNNGTLITGSGTLFTTELESGEWIYVAGINEFKQVDRILSNTVLYVKSPFVGAVSGATAKRTPRQVYKSISWKIDSTAPASINGIAFEANNSGTLEFDEVGRTRPKPIIVDATSAVVYLQVQY